LFIGNVRSVSSRVAAARSNQPFELLISNFNSMTPNLSNGNKKIDVNEQHFSYSSSSSSPLPSPASTLSSRVKLSYGVGHVLNDLVASCWFSYFLVFLRTVLLFPAAEAGFLLLIGQISDGLATPVVGILSDKTRSKFGKRRLWITLGSICVILTFPFIFHSVAIEYFETSNILRLIYYSFFIILFQFSWASVQVSHLALVPELTRDTSERVMLNSMRSIATILSNVAVFMMAFFILRSESLTGLGPDDTEAFFHLSLLVLFIGSIFSMIFIFGVPDPNPRSKRSGSNEMLWHHWFYRIDFYITAIIYTCTRLMVNVSQVYIPLFLVMTLHAPKSSIASVPLTVFASGLLSTCVCERLTRRFGSEGLTFFGCLIILCSCAYWQLIYALAFILGSGTGIVGVSALGLICDLVGESCESGAFVYGSMSFADKIANGAAIMIAESFAPVSACENNNNQSKPCNVVTPQQENYYRLVMILAPSVSAIIAMIMLAIILINRRFQSNPPVSISPHFHLQSPCEPNSFEHTRANAMTGVQGVHIQATPRNANHDIEIDENTPLIG